MFSTQQELNIILIKISSRIPFCEVRIPFLETIGGKKVIHIEKNDIYCTAGTGAALLGWKCRDSFIRNWRARKLPVSSKKVIIGRTYATVYSVSDIFRFIKPTIREDELDEKIAAFLHEQRIANSKRGRKKGISTKPNNSSKSYAELMLGYLNSMDDEDAERLLEMLR